MEIAALVGGYRRISLENFLNPKKSTINWDKTKLLPDELSHGPVGM